MAIYAIHQQDPKFIIIINYKVMYSSLYEILPTHFPEMKFHHKNSAAKFNFHDFPKFSIVRNPFSRVVSTFYGKCRKSPEISLIQETAQLEYCQHQLLQTLNKIRNKTYAIAEPANSYTLKENPDNRALLNENFKLLMGISFPEYVESLTLILKNKRVDGHFQKQFGAFSVPHQNPFYFPSKFFRNTQIIKIENIDQDWKILCNQLDKEIVLIKTNRTDDIRPSTESFYTDQIRKQVAELYKIDFKKFNYPLHF